MFVVRNDTYNYESSIKNRRYYSGVYPFKSAQRFESIDEARVAVAEPHAGERRIYAVEYVLRWHNRDGGKEHYGPTLEHTFKQRNARRFATAQEAVDYLVMMGFGLMLYGAGGPDDRDGYKPTPILKRVK